MSHFSIDFFSTGKGILQEIHASSSHCRIKAQSIIPLADTLRLGLQGDPVDVWDKAVLSGVRPTALGQSNAREIRIVDLFCGCGGFTEGVKHALASLGYRPAITAAIDIDKEALRLYQVNHKPGLALNADVNSVIKYRTRRSDHGGIEFADVRYEINDIRAIETLMGGCDILLAGPPCQGHSNLNNHSRRSDPRNNLYMSVAAYASMLHPSHVVIENVQPVLHDKQDVVSKTEDLLKQLGYNVDHLTVDGTSIGMSQTRKRHFLVASLSQALTINDYYDEYRLLYPPPSRSVSWCFGLLPKVVDVENPFYVPSELSAENQLRVSWLHENCKYDLPNELRPKCHQREHNYKSVYGRMIPNLPAGTITTGYHSPGRGRYVHPWEPRVITSCEAALIQGFPIDYQFNDGKSRFSRASHAKVIGDAVSPVMSRFIGLFIGVETRLSDLLCASNAIHAC